MFIKLVILSSIFLSLAVIGFAIRVLIKSHGQFPETHVSRNPEMRKRGIACAQKTDVGCNPTDDFPGCASCSEKSYSI